MYIEGFSEGRVRTNDRAANEQFQKLGRLNSDITNLIARALRTPTRTHDPGPPPSGG